jgi:hypothetical protein
MTIDYRYLEVVKEAAAGTNVSWSVSRRCIWRPALPKPAGTNTAW